MPPHVDSNAASPQSTPTGGGTAEKKARIGMLPTLSIADYAPDQQQLDEALGVNTEASQSGAVNPMSRFKQPEFGG